MTQEVKPTVALSSSLDFLRSGMRSVIPLLHLRVVVDPATNLSPSPVNAMLRSGGDFLWLKLLQAFPAELM